MASQQTQPYSSTTVEKSQEETEIIYVLKNPAMPNYVKIGKTENLQQRMKDLDNTSVPGPLFYMVLNSHEGGRNSFWHQGDFCLGC